MDRPPLPLRDDASAPVLSRPRLLLGPRPAARIDPTDAPRAASSTWTIWGVAADARVVQIVVIGTFLLLAAFNHVVIQPEYTQFVLYFVIPVAIVVVAWREDPRRFGLRIGDWRLGLGVAGVAVVILTVVIYAIGRDNEFVRYYSPLTHGRPAERLIFDTALGLIGWEFFCRGWLLFGLARRYGADAVWLQIIPFALMHLYKPETEQLTTVLGGAFFGLLAWRTRSVLYGWLIHSFMLSLVIARAAGWL